MTRIFAVFAAFLVLTPLALADEFEDEVAKILTLSNAIEPSIFVMKTMIKTSSPVMVEQIYREYSQAGKKVTKADVEDLVATFRDRVVDRFRNELLPIMVGEFRKQFTLEDMRNLRQLMETPAYRTYAERLPDIVESSKVAGEEVGRRIGRDVMLEVINENPKFQD